MATPSPISTPSPPPPVPTANTTMDDTQPSPAPAPVLPAKAKQVAQAAAAAVMSSSMAMLPPPSVDQILLADGSLDMRVLMIALWKHRTNSAFTTELCARLPYLSISKATLDQVEFYLPQLAHMVVHLEKELPMEAMEQFVLLLSQTSVHFALQFFWIIFAALDENRPKRNGDPRTFARCAQLLLALEQCFVYGSPAAKEATELMTRNSISKAEMEQIVMADRRFLAAQSSLEICYEGGAKLNCTTNSDRSGSSIGSSIGSNSSAATTGASVNGVHNDSGWLFKKGGGTRKMGRRNWTLRWCRVENRILLVFTRPSDQRPRTAFPLVRADIRVVENKRHPFYFELVHALSESRMQFAAQSQEELVAWIALLQKHAAAPEPPTVGALTSSSPSKAGAGHSLARMSFAMRSFILQSSSSSPVPATTATAAPAAAEGENSSGGVDIASDTREIETPLKVSEASASSPPPSPRSKTKSLTASSSAHVTGAPELQSRAQTIASITSTSSSGVARASASGGVRSQLDVGGASSTSLAECFQLQPTGALSPEQQRRYEFFTGMIQFIKAITDVSESLRRIEPPKRKALLGPRLETLEIPPLAYLPLCKSTDTYCNVTSVFTKEGRVFSTNERAPCMIYFAVEENERGDDVSKALFTHLYAGSDDLDMDLCLSDDDVGGDGYGSDDEDDDAEDVTTVDSADEILKYLADSPSKASARAPAATVAVAAAASKSALSLGAPTKSSTTPSPFVRQLLESPERKQKLEKIFGELSFSAIERLKRASGVRPTDARWQLSGLMAKSYDDLRQEVLVMQLIAFFQQIFHAEKLDLWLQPYRILSTGASTGLLEVVRNAISLDGIKKTPGFKNLRTHFVDVYGCGSDGGDGGDSSDTGDALLKQAELNFVQSLAAYSIVCYMLAIKDRHNGNILLDIEGHIVHIDFGFFLGRAPGGSFSFETAPFKLTAEMVDALGGRQSPNFTLFCDLCVQGALAARKHGETIYTLVEVMSLRSKLPCFVGNSASHLAGLRDRLFLNVTDDDKVAPMIRTMIDRSYDHFGTKQYDQFQVYSNGIAK